MITGGLTNSCVFPEPSNRPGPIQRHVTSVYTTSVKKMHAVALMFSSNFHHFATAFLVSCFVHLIDFLRKRGQSVQTPSEPDFQPGDGKSVPKKARKKGNLKKKKNRGGGYQQNKENLLEASGENSSEGSEECQQNAAAIKPLLETRSNQIKTVKIYSPLNLFLELEMEQPEIYARLRPYVLRLKDIIDNGFPHYSPDKSGKVISTRNFAHCTESENPSQRWCCRCGERFTISEDNVYEAGNICNYHRGKRVAGGPYSCCGSTTPEGCASNRFHVSSNTTLRNVNYVKTREKKHASAQNTIYALDCEMCYTFQGLEITRVSMVGTDGLTIYDSYVVPDNPIIDYNTRYSGITADHLKGVKTTLADVRAILLRYLNSKTILIGHGLENDLKALHIVHETIVDTSVVFPHCHGPPFKRSLKAIAANVLEQVIQSGTQGHDSVEDARTCMELMLWKIQTDGQVCMQPNVVVPPLQPFPVAPHAFNPIAVIPYNVGYWVPPVGSSSDLY